MPRNIVPGTPGVGHQAVLHLDLDAQMPLDARDGINGDAGHAWPPGRCARSARSGAVSGQRWAHSSRRCCARLADGRADGMDGGQPGDGANDADAHLLGGRPRRQSPARWQRAIEGRHRVPEFRLRAADAAVADADRPVGAVVPLDLGAVVVRRGAFAAHLVEAPALLVALVAPLLDELAGVVVRAARAGIVDAVAVREERTVQLVGRRQLLEGEPVHDGRREISAIHRAGAEVDEIRAGDRIVDADRAGHAAGRRRDAAEGGAGADGDGRIGAAADLAWRCRARRARRWCSRCHSRRAGSSLRPPPGIGPCIA